MNEERALSYAYSCYHWLSLKRYFSRVHACLHVNQASTWLLARAGKFMREILEGLCRLHSQL